MSDATFDQLAAAARGQFDLIEISHDTGQDSDGRVFFRFLVPRHAVVTKQQLMKAIYSEIRRAQGPLPPPAIKGQRRKRVPRNWTVTLARRILDAAPVPRGHMNTTLRWFRTSRRPDNYIRVKLTRRMIEQAL